MKRPLELDLFSETDQDHEVEKIQWNEIKTETVLGNDLQSLHFTIPKANDRKLIDLQRAQLMLDVTFTKVGKRDELPFGPVNNILHSLFENCVISVNDETVLDANSNYHYSSYILDLLDRTKEQKEGLMTSQLWFEDVPGKFDEVANTGFLKRAKAAESNIQLIGKLHSELFNQDRYMLNDVKLSVELVLAKDTFYMMSTNRGTGKYVTKINDAALYIPYVQIAEREMESIQKTLQTKPAIYPIQRVYTKSIPITSLVNDASLNISKGRLPKRIVVGFITDKAKNGTYTKNPFKFLGAEDGVFALDKLELNVDGMPYAKRALKPNFDKNDFRKTFMNLFESLNYIEDGSNAPAISVDSFKGGNCLFAYNLNPTCCSSSGAFKREGEVTLDISFSTAPTETLQAIVLCIFDNEITLDKNRHVSRDW